MEVGVDGTVGFEAGVGTEADDSIAKQTFHSVVDEYEHAAGVAAVACDDGP